MNILRPRNSSMRTCRFCAVVGGAALAFSAVASAGTYSVEVLNFGDQTAIWAASDAGGVLGFSGSFNDDGVIEGGHFLQDPLGFQLPVIDPTPEGFFPVVFTGVNSSNMICGFYSDDPLLDFAISFTMDPFGNLVEHELGGDDTGTFMRDINDSGDTAGNIFNPFTLDNIPFVRQSDGTVSQGKTSVLPPAGHSMIDVTLFGISNNGNLCGEGMDEDGNIVIWRVVDGVFETHIVDHTMRALEAVDINDAGTVVGNVHRFSDNESFPFRWDDTGVQELESFFQLLPPEATMVRAVDIANDDTIIGFYFYDFNGLGDLLPRGYVATLGPVTDCPADLTGGKGKGGDGVVDVFDLLTLLSNWAGKGAGADLAKPLGVVDVFDLLELLGQWGPCDDGGKGKG